MILYGARQVSGVGGGRPHPRAYALSPKMSKNPSVFVSVREVSVVLSRAGRDGGGTLWEFLSVFMPVYGFCHAPTGINLSSVFITVTSPRVLSCAGLKSSSPGQVVTFSCRRCPMSQRTWATDRFLWRQHYEDAGHPAEAEGELFFDHRDAAMRRRLKNRVLDAFDHGDGADLLPPPKDANSRRSNNPVHKRKPCKVVFLFPTLSSAATDDQRLLWVNPSPSMKGATGGSVSPPMNKIFVWRKRGTWPP